MLPPAITSPGFMETHNCRGRWELQSLLCIPELPVWEFRGEEDGRGQRKRSKFGHLSKDGIYHLGHLFMYTSESATESGA